MEEMGTRLRSARVNAGFKSARSAAIRFGWTVSTYNAHENGQNEFGPDIAAIYARAFDVSPGWLLTGEEPGAVEAPPRDAGYQVEPNAIMEGPVQKPYTPPIRDVEELGLGVASIDEDDSAFEFNGQVVDRVIRPPGLANRPGVFALRVANLSMWPRFRDGERIYVDTKRPAIEDFVVVELHPTEEGRAGKAYVKMLTGRDAKRIRVEQFNPAGVLEFDQREIKRIFRVIPTEELWG